MSDVVIKAEGLSKKYTISHEGSEKYTALRDVIHRSTMRLFGKSGKKVKEEFWALKDISFEIKQGEAIGIIGRNGAGKSTLLKILSRITEPTTGRVEIKGRTSSLLEVGTGFHPELTGRENIFLNGAVMGMSRAEIKKKFDDIVDFSGVERFLDTPVKRYSSGMYLRLAFAVAAHLEPEILIVDEVLAVGDVEFQKKCLGKMDEVSKKSGRTVLFVSHNLTALRKLCSQGIFLNEGMVSFSGSIDRAINKYVDSGEVARSVYDISKPILTAEVSGFAYRVIIEDGYGNMVKELPVGAAWQVRVRFVLLRKLEHFIIALGIGSSDVGIRTAWSPERDLEEGDYEAVFKEDQLLLSEGSYQLTIGLSSFERTIHYTENAATIAISNIPDPALDKSIVRTSGTGLLLNPMHVTVSSLSGILR